MSHGVAVGMDRAGELMVGTHYRENLGERVTGGGCSLPVCFNNFHVGDTFSPQNLR